MSTLEEKIAVPYAEALIDYAQSKNSLSEATKDMSSILTILSESQDLQIVLLNPLINGLIKKEILQTCEACSNKAALKTH